MDNAASQVENSSFDERHEIHKFLRDEVFMLTLMAVTQRGQVYSETSTETEKAYFQGCLRDHLDRMIKEKYRGPIAHETHVQNIVSLASQLTKSCGKLLYKNRFRIGSAQKALNLFLKYLWCLGEIPDCPPHCPFDRRIIEKLKLPNGVQRNWVQCDKAEDYECWVAAARKEAEQSSLSLAEWELVTYNKTG